MRELKKLKHDFSICKLATINNIKWEAEYVHLSKNVEEISLVCASGHEPADAIAVEAGWKAFKVLGPPEFSLVRIIADISGTLGENSISIFVISTFNTDYVLLRERDCDKAARILAEAGYVIS